MRVARLEGNGVPDPGANNLYVTDSIVRLTITPVLKEGIDLEKENGCGEACVTFKDCDRLKRLDLELEICDPDPELHELLVGGTVLTTAGQTRGYQVPVAGTQDCPFGVSIEAWTKAITGGALDPEFPYWRWVLPRTFWQLAPRNLANEIMEVTFTGFANENPNWFNGPANDWSFSSTRLLQYARETTLPIVQCGYATLSAS